MRRNSVELYAVIVNIEAGCAKSLPRAYGAKQYMKKLAKLDNYITQYSHFLASIQPSGRLVHRRFNNALEHIILQSFPELQHGIALTII